MSKINELHFKQFICQHHLRMSQNLTNKNEDIKNNSICKRDLEYIKFNISLCITFITTILRIEVQLVAEIPCFDVTKFNKFNILISII